MISMLHFEPTSEQCLEQIVYRLEHICDCLDGLTDTLTETNNQLERLIEQTGKRNKS